jgi:hypothetical protein
VPASARSCQYIQELTHAVGFFRLLTDNGPYGYRLICGSLDGDWVILSLGVGLNGVEDFAGHLASGAAQRWSPKSTATVRSSTASRYAPSQFCISWSGCAIKLGIGMGAVFEILHPAKDPVTLLFDTS